MWKAEVTSKATIKPSSPTPPHLRTHNLSWLDRRVNEQVHIAFILVYPNSDPNSLPLLTSSLSQTLSIFYPLAGRLDGSGTYVDCNDQGISLIEARATLSDHDHDHVESMETLLPCSHCCSKDSRSSNGPLVSVQITSIGDGIAIGFCISHKIADGHSATSFIAAWAAVSRGDDAGAIPRPLFDAASIFVPPNGGGPSRGPPPVLGRLKSPAKLVRRRFHFEEHAIAAIKNQHAHPITRVQAVIALIWRCCVRARESERRSTASVAGVVVNMRGKGAPPLPGNLFGNACCMAAAAMPDHSEELGGFGGKVSGAIDKTTAGDGALMGYEAGEEGWSLLSDPVFEARKECGGSECSEIDTYFFSSWTRFPLSEADFGWGKPASVGMGRPLVGNAVILMAGGAGGWMEAYVVLNEEEMKRFETDDEITAAIC